MRSILIAAGAAILAAAIAQAATTAPSAELKTDEDRLNYAIGRQIGENLKHDKVEYRAEPMSRGIADAMAGTGGPLSREEQDRVLTDLQKKVNLANAEEARLRGEKAISEGQVFLAANGKKEGVKTTASGLQIKVLKEGEGTSPTPADTVTVHYRGTLIDGTEFDSSFKRNQPASFKLAQVIKGWTEGMQQMKPGGKYQLFIPAPLAYGERGWGKEIPPNSVLIFEVDLLGVKTP